MCWKSVAINTGYHVAGVLVLLSCDRRDCCWAWPQIFFTFCHLKPLLLIYSAQVVISNQMSCLLKLQDLSKLSHSWQFSFRTSAHLWWNTDTSCPSWIIWFLQGLFFFSFSQHLYMRKWIMSQECSEFTHSRTVSLTPWHQKVQQCWRWQRAGCH